MMELNLKMITVKLVPTSTILKNHATSYVITQQVLQKLCSSNQMNAKNVEMMKNGQVTNAKNVEPTKNMTQMELHVNAKVKVMAPPLLKINLHAVEIPLHAMMVGSQKDHATKNVLILNTSNLMLAQHVIMQIKD